MKRSEFASALKILIPGIQDENSILEGADTFMFCGEWLKSNNGRITIALPFPTEVRGSVKAMEFWRVLEKMKSEDFDLTLDEETLRVTSGDIDLKMLIMPLPAHADIPVPTEWLPIPEDFMEAIKLVTLSVDGSPILGILSGLYVKDNDMLSCDNSRASWFVMKAPMDSFIVTAEAAKLITRFDFVEYHIGDSDVSFRTKDGVVFTCSKVSGAYPAEKIKQLFVASEKVYNLPMGLRESVNKAAIFASTEEAGNIYITLRMDKSKKNIVVRGEKPFGTFQEKVKLEDGTFPDGVLDVHPAFLSEVLKITNEMYSVGNDHILFRIGNFQHLISLVA